MRSIRYESPLLERLMLNPPRRTEEVLVELRVTGRLAVTWLTWGCVE